MSSQNTTGRVSSSTESTRERAAHKGTFASLEEAQQVKPPSDKFRVFAVKSPAGKEVWTWAHSIDMALVNAARVDGYTARVAEPKAGGPVTKEKIAASLAAMSPEERAILIAQYVPAPTPTPSGKGKKQ